MGGADLGGRGGDDERRRRVGHLRPDQHPPDRLPLRAAVRGEPPLREGPGVAPGAARRGPHGAAHRRVGRRPGRARRGRHAPDEPPRRTRRVPPGAGQPAARHETRHRRAARPPGAGRDRDRPGGRPATRSGSPPAPSRSRSRPATPRSIEATVPTWRRDLLVEADIAEEVIRVRGYELVPATPARTRRCRPTDPIRSRSATPSARRSPAPA